MSGTVRPELNELGLGNVDCLPARLGIDLDRARLVRRRIFRADYPARRYDVKIPSACALLARNDPNIDRAIDEVFLNESSYELILSHIIVWSP